MESKHSYDVLITRCTEASHEMNGTIRALGSIFQHFRVLEPF